MKKGIERIYSEVANTYELANHVLTFGMDMVWRRKAAKTAKNIGGNLWLDVCSGTGEMAINLAKKANNVDMILAVDGSLPMLSIAKNKKIKNKLSFALADAGKLPFNDDTFDLISISFATRNLNPNPEALLTFLKEFNRILKPEGSFLNLETSQPESKWIKKLFHGYVKLLVKPVGYILSGSKAGYNYLSHTIPRFYDAREFSSLLLKAGFKAAKYRSLLLGIAAIHTAEK